MKVRNLFSAVVVPSLFAAALILTAGVMNTAQALTIIDGTAPGYLLDGSFEAGSDGSPVDWRGNDTGSVLSSNLGIDLPMVYRDNLANPSDGTQYTVIGRQDDGDDYGIYVDTGYNLAAGDKFDLSFFHGFHSSVEAGDNFRWQLFTTTTNSDSGIVADILASGTVLANTSTTLQLESYANIGTVTPAEAGDRLFLAFLSTSSAGASTLTDFIALDQVNLSVTAATPIPEPGSLTLLIFGLAGTCAMRRRGKRMA